MNTQEERGALVLTCDLGQQIDFDNGASIYISEIKSRKRAKIVFLCPKSVKVTRTWKYGPHLETKEEYERRREMYETREV